VSKLFAIAMTPPEIEHSSILESSLEEILEYLCSQGKIDQAEDIYLPLVEQIISWQQEIDRPLIQGIVGGQGTGKTTLCRLLQKTLEIAGYAVASLSLDDLYKTYAERQELQIQEPRLRWRGPPGTHDIQLGLDILEQVRISTSLRLPSGQVLREYSRDLLSELSPNSQPTIVLPRFDKSLWDGMGDRTTPELVKMPDILLFEGWFVGVLPRIDLVNVSPFTHYINQQLYNYLPLWKKLDKLILLYPEDYRFSLQWRLQAEQEMIAHYKSINKSINTNQDAGADKNTGEHQPQNGMTSAEITDFVEYFWEALPPDLFISPLTKPTTTVDLIIPLKADHSFGRPYSPREN
jgi:D-glycerate 3-kinase